MKTMKQAQTKVERKTIWRYDETTRRDRGNEGGRGEKKNKGNRKSNEGKLRKERKKKNEERGQKETTQMLGQGKTRGNEGRRRE